MLIKKTGQRVATLTITLSLVAAMASLTACGGGSTGSGHEPVDNSPHIDVSTTSHTLAIPDSYSKLKPLKSTLADDVTSNATLTFTKSKVKISDDIVIATTEDNSYLDGVHNCEIKSGDTSCSLTLSAKHDDVDQSEENISFTATNMTEGGRSYPVSPDHESYKVVSHNKPVPDPTPPLPQAASGQIIYHFAQDPAGITVFPYTTTSPTYEILDLSKSNFSTVIMTNIIAGVVMGDLLHTKWPKMKFNRDYVYGSLLGQIFQEDTNFANTSGGACHTSNSTQLQNNTKDCNLTSVMATGGPYQINSYQMAVVQPSAATKFSGLYSYAALAKNLDFKQGEPLIQAPDSFNDTYFGPMIAAYFHYMQALNLYGIQHPEYGPTPNKTIIDACFNTLSGVSAPTKETNLFDLILNNAYNAGENTETFTTYVKDCTGITADPSRSNDYSYLLDPADYTAKTHISSANSMFANYPRQVRVYLDQIFNNNNPGVPAPRKQTSIPYTLGQMQTIFSYVMQKLSYFKGFQNISVNVSGSTLSMQYGYNITAIDQQVSADAFAAAMKDESSTYTQDTKLNLGDATQRGAIFNILEGAVKRINIALAKKPAIGSLAKTTEDIFSQDVSSAPACIDDKNIKQYVSGTKYAVGDLMKQKSFAFKCKQAGWCGVASYDPFTAAKASDWQAAWDLVPNVTGNKNGYDCSKTT